MKPIPYGHQDINQADIDAVLEVLQSDWLTQGPAITCFERKVADYCGAQYAIAVSSATAALHLACLAAGLAPDMWLWTSPNTFVASANCGRYCGVNVDFVDIDPRTYNLSIAELETKLIQADKQQKLPKVVIPVHFSGQSCQMAEIAALAQQYQFTVIEDASHALGGSYRGQKVGSCAFSDMVVLSFHPVKIITTGEGGMILTNKLDLYEKLLRLRSHGITREPQQMQEEIPGAWYYQQIDLGYNYRLTDLQAALGVSQMARLDAFVARRHQLVARYHHRLADLPLILPYEAAEAFSAYHLYVIQLKLNEISKTRAQVFQQLRAANILVNVHYIPVHTQPYYQQLGFKMGDFPQAEQYYQAAISLPLFPSLTEQEQDYVIHTVRQAIIA
jgi:UDP-4-amino-4,6-dideoxy-N-acetyl-beta-L-altrosamine transaminase